MNECITYYLKIKKRGDIYIFGGKGERSLLNDTHCYNEKNCSWDQELNFDSLLCNKSKPSSRQCCHLEIINNNLIMFGGSTSTEFFTYDLFVMDLSTRNEWKKIPNADNFHQNHSLYPVPRDKFGMCRYKNDMVLFGGITFEKQCLNDLWVLETSELLSEAMGTNRRQLCWRQYSPRANAYWPNERYHHCNTIIHSNMFLLGGELIFKYLT